MPKLFEQGRLDLVWFDFIWFDLIWYDLNWIESNQSKANKMKWNKIILIILYSLSYSISFFFFFTPSPLLVGKSAATLFFGNLSLSLDEKMLKSEIEMFTGNFLFLFPSSSFCSFTLIYSFLFFVDLFRIWTF